MSVLDAIGHTTTLLQEHARVLLQSQSWGPRPVPSSHVCVKSHHPHWTSLSSLPWPVQAPQDSRALQGAWVNLTGKNTRLEDFCQLKQGAESFTYGALTGPAGCGCLCPFSLPRSHSIGTSATLGCTPGFSSPTLQTTHWCSAPSAPTPPSCPRTFGFAPTPRSLAHARRTPPVPFPPPSTPSDATSSWRWRGCIALSRRRTLQRENKVNRALKRETTNNTQWRTHSSLTFLRGRSVDPGFLQFPSQEFPHEVLFSS